MFTDSKEWSTTYLNHKIVVRNSWELKGFQFDVSSIVKFDVSSIAKLYIDGEKKDESNQNLVSPDIPHLSGKFREGNIDHIVEIYIKTGLFKVMAKIYVDGKEIAGDAF